MIRRERKFHSEEFREHVLTAYYNNNESVDRIARCFPLKRGTISSGVYRKNIASFFGKHHGLFRKTSRPFFRSIASFFSKERPQGFSGKTRTSFSLGGNVFQSLLSSCRASGLLLAFMRSNKV